MAINVSVQYNGGLLPGIILLTQQFYYHRRTHLNGFPTLDQHYNVGEKPTIILFFFFFL